MRMLLLVSLVLGASILIACSGNGGGTEANATLAPVPAEYAGITNPLGAEAAVQGAKVFQSTCATCHGSQGHGDGPASGSLDPKPKNLAEIQSVAGDDYLFWRVSTGKPGTAMVAWQGILTEEQIWQVIAFIRTLE